MQLVQRLSKTLSNLVRRGYRLTLAACSRYGSHVLRKSCCRLVSGLNLVLRNAVGQLRQHPLHQEGVELLSVSYRRLEIIDVLAQQVDHRKKIGGRGGSKHVDGGKCLVLSGQHRPDAGDGLGVCLHRVLEIFDIVVLLGENEALLRHDTRRGRGQCARADGCQCARGLLLQRGVGPESGNKTWHCIGKSDSSGCKIVANRIEVLDNLSELSVPGERQPRQTLLPILNFSLLTLSGCRCRSVLWPSAF